MGYEEQRQGGIVIGDAGFSIGMLLGFMAGIGAGTGIGIAIGMKQKPWSELTDSEKRTRIAFVTAGGVLLVAGVVVFLIRLYS